MEFTRGATKDYRTFSDNPWSFWNVLISRRSHRKYADMVPDARLFKEIADLIRLSCAGRRCSEESILMVEESQAVEELSRCIYKGLGNRINAWLYRNRPAGFLIMVAEREDALSTRPEGLARAAMVLEDTVLFMTEKELGSCWLGGVNMGEIRRIIGLDSAKYVPIAICFGKPDKSGGISYDRIASMAMTKRRKPISKIAHAEYFGNRFLLAGSDFPAFCVSDTQDVYGLVEKIANDKWDVSEPPLNLTLEASIEAARLAPSAGNAQPWHFIVIKERKRLNSLLSLCGMEGEFRAAMVAAGETRFFETRVFEKPFWMIDVPIAMSHLTLLLASLECPCRIALDGIDEEAINHFVHLPKGIRTVGVIYVS